MSDVLPRAGVISTLIPDRRAAVAVLAMLVLSVASDAIAQKPKPVAIFVGPDTRGGFVDADQGILDSIEDIQKALNRKPLLRVVGTAAEATVVLVVEDRGAGERDAGMASVPIGNQRLYVPIGTMAIATVLQVGNYQRPIGCVGETWRACAQQIVRDVEGWVTANRERLSSTPTSAADGATGLGSHQCASWVSAYRATDQTAVQRLTSEAVLAWVEEYLRDRTRPVSASVEPPSRAAVEGLLLARCMGVPTDRIQEAARAIAPNLGRQPQ